MSRRTPLEQKLGTFIRMLASERDGEVVAAARAIVRTLKAAADIHVLAERVETADGSKLTDAEMRKLYDAGYDAGVRAAETKQHVLATSTTSTAPPPGTRSRASASKAAIDCERRSANSSTTWRRERSGASQPSGNPNGCAASSTDSAEAFEFRWRGPDGAPRSDVKMKGDTVCTIDRPR
jgi:hypothetical protein